MANPSKNQSDRIAEFYRNKTVFVTGGTGFMGKVLIEKLLRGFADINKIFVLVRAKKMKNYNVRMNEILSGPLFELVKKEQGEEVIKKVVPIYGDVLMMNLGICNEDIDILKQEVDIMFHCAASVKFDDPLKKAVLLNTRGTKYTMEVAKQFNRLECFVHVSTAYCHLNERILYEKAYPPPSDPHNVIKIVECLDEESIIKITPKLLGNVPNTYSYSKALGEALVVEESSNLPILLLRPSVVIPIWKEPLPGWTDNINGPTGLLIGAGKGVIRSMYCKSERYADYLPVDIFANAAIAAVFDYIHYKKVRWIYHLTSSSEHKITMDEIINIGRRLINEKMPLNAVAWYPGGSMKRSKFVHNICFFLFHLVPAVLVDAILIAVGHKPVLWRIQMRIKNGLDVFEYYANHQWDFDNTNAMEGRKLMNAVEREKYKVDGNGIDYDEYFLSCLHAARLYILKEPDETIPAAKRHMKVMWFVDKLFKTFFFSLLIYFLYKKLV